MGTPAALPLHGKRTVHSLLQFALSASQFGNFLSLSPFFARLQIAVLATVSVGLPKVFTHEKSARITHLLAKSTQKTEEVLILARTHFPRHCLRLVG